MTAARKLQPPPIDRRPTPAVRGRYDRARIRITAGQLNPGTRYQVTRWLGEGGMGVVYEAQHVDIEQRVAVKILRHRFCGDPAAVNLFRQEARATGRLGSENIVQTRDFAELPDGRLMIAMEFLEGQDLQSAIEGPMDPSRAIAILRQCCRGLAAAHDQGLIHRDIKPENIFLTPEGGRPDRVKLLDFGISMFIDGETKDRTVGGTPGFLAPEAILQGRVSPAIDQFALGSVAYAMLTGAPAFRGDSVEELIAATLEPVPPPDRVQSDIPAPLAEVISRCLASEPQQRFESMQSLEAALCRAQIETGIQTAWDDLPLPEIEPETRAWLLANMPEPGTGLLRSRQRRAMVVALAAALGLGALGAAGAFLAVQEDQEDQELIASSVVQDMSEAARDAAAKALFVYPPFDAPQTPTAFRIVRDLETLEGPESEAAAAEAATLRNEFAQTLSRLGDAYWSADGGRIFAIAYYEQAVLFAPGLEPAADRSTISDERRESLVVRATLADFSPMELASAEPLAILANDDVDARRTELSRYQQRRASRLETLQSHLARRKSTKRRTPHPKKKADSANTDPDRAEASQRVLPVSTDVVVDPAPKRSKTGAAKAASHGHAAFRSGNDSKAEALFEQALGMDPGNPRALSGLRDLYFDRGDYGRAIRYGKRAVRAKPRSPGYRVRLGDAYFKTSRYELAVRQYQEASRLGAPEAKARLARARQRLP